MSTNEQDKIDALHVVAETMVPPYKEVLVWMRKLAAVANADSGRDAERDWNALIAATTESREAMDALFRAAQLLRDSEVITGLEAAWVFGQLYERHEWRFPDTLDVHAQLDLEAGFYEVRGEVRLAAEFRAHPEKCWADWEEGGFTLEDMRGVDARLGAPSDPATVAEISAALEACVDPVIRSGDDRALQHFAAEIRHGQVTAAVRAAQECRERGKLTRTETAQFLIALLAPVVLGMCQFDRSWRQLTEEILDCLRKARSVQAGTTAQRLWERHAQLVRCRARRESQMWAYCFRVFGEHELARVMRSDATQSALAA